MSKTTDERTLVARILATLDAVRTETKVKAARARFNAAKRLAAHCQPVVQLAMSDAFIGASRYVRSLA